MAILTKEQVVEASDLPRELVDVPEWGGEVWVGTMTGADASYYQTSLLNIDGEGKVKSVNVEGADVRLAALTIQNEDGSLMFGRKEVEALGKKSPKALERVCKVAQRLNGLDDGAEDREAGNSGAMESGGSPSK